MSEFVYAVRDGEEYWFQGVEGREAFFVSRVEYAKPYTNQQDALHVRDTLAELMLDDLLHVLVIERPGGVDPGGRPRKAAKREKSQ